MPDPFSAPVAGASTIALPEPHFESMAQQAHAARLGMWVFLASELLLFAGLFALMATYRLHFPAGFQEGVRHNTKVLGSMNTAVLLISSTLAASSVHALRADRRRVAISCLIGTVVLGAVFLAVKLTEYAVHFREGIYPRRPRRILHRPSPSGAARNLDAVLHRHRPPCRTRHGRDGPPRHRRGGGRAATNHAPRAAAIGDRRDLLAPGRRRLELRLASLLPGLTMNRVAPTMKLTTTAWTGTALLALWTVSFALSYLPLGAAALPLALAIAGAKGLLVLFVFMELAVAPLSIRLAVLAALSMIALLIGLMAADVVTRPPPPLLPVSPSSVPR